MDQGRCLRRDGISFSNVVARSIRSWSIDATDGRMRNERIILLDGGGEEVACRSDRIRKTDEIEGKDKGEGRERGTDRREEGRREERWMDGGMEGWREWRWCFWGLV